MRHLSSVLLLAPAIASAQLRPARLAATRELYIAADSARASSWGRMLRDHDGTFFFDRVNDTDNILAMAVVEALPNGRVRNTGPAGAAVNGRVLGLLRVPGDDSLWILDNYKQEILVPGQAPVKLGDRWINDQGKRGDSLRAGLPSTLLADRSMLWSEFHFPHRWIEIDAHGALVGEVVIPTGTMLRGGLRDRVWGTVPDAAGAYAGVVMYKISRP